ncbi:MAG: hypothetical protein WD810_01530 [Solirubrobacterales bacterium]
MTVTKPGVSGSHVELGRYVTPAGHRVLVGRRIDGIVHVFDWPASGRGCRYLVEAGLSSKAELAMLVADYRRQAELLRACPMSGEAICV